MARKRINQTNTPAAKAAKNLEALKKAKEAAIKEEQKAAKEAPVEQAGAETVKTPEPKAQESKKSAAKAEKKDTLPLGKTSYESAMNARKLVSKTLVSQTLFKDEKGIEQIKEVWKNHTTNETYEFIFPVIAIKEGDCTQYKIDVDALRKKAFPETAKTPKKEEKPAATKKEKPATPKKEKPAEVLIPETIEDSEKKIPQVVQTPGKSKAGRIDANHTIDLLKLAAERRKELETDGAAPNLLQGLTEQCDLMLFASLHTWNEQYKEDCAEVGIKVNEQMFNRLSLVGKEFLGIKLIGNKTDDGQLQIDFTKTEETAPETTKQAIKADAKREIITEVPTPESCTNDEQKIAAIGSILNMRGKDAMAINMYNAVQFVKKAFPAMKDASFAQCVSFIYDNVPHSVLLTGYSNAVLGNIESNLTVISVHSWLRKMFANFTDIDDTQIAYIAQIMLSRALNARSKDEKDYEEKLKQYSQLIASFKKDMIEKIVNNKKEDKKLNVTLNLGSLKLKNKVVPALNTVNYVKQAYGTSLSDKLIKNRITEILPLYSEGILPYSFYNDADIYKS